MQSYEINKHGKIVFPSNCFPDLDFSTFESLEQLDAVVRRDFDSKAPTGTDILEGIKTGAYQSKFELMRDMALNLFWANRFKMTMYDVRPTRWADVPRRRDDLFVPILTPWEDRESKVTAVQSAYPNLSAQWDDEVEDAIFEVLFDVFGHRRNHATKLSAVVPTVADLLSDPGNQTLRLNRYDPDFRRYSYADIIDCDEDVAELEALHRWSMVLHNQYPWDRSEATLVPVGELRDDDYVAVFHPRDREVQLFLSRVASGTAAKTARSAAPEVHAPIRPYPAIDVRNDFQVQPRIEAIAAVHGDLVCTNEDLIRNSAYNWSPMSADEISCQDRHRGASLHVRQPRGPVVAGRPIGDGACWSGSRGDRCSFRVHLHQLSADPVRRDLAVRPVGHSADARLVRPRRRMRGPELRAGRGHQSSPTGPAAGAGGLRGEVLRQDRERPPVPHDLRRRRSRHRPRRRARGFTARHRIHADVRERSGKSGQLDLVAQSRVRQQHHGLRAGGEGTRRALPGQMLDDIRALPDPDGVAESLLASIELIIPHQANKTMVTDLATGAGLSPDQLYFNIEQVGNASSASIPLAIHDAVRDGAISSPTRIFAPGFGAGAVAGYAVMRIDPAVIAPDDQATPPGESAEVPESPDLPAGAEMASAFG